MHIYKLILFCFVTTYCSITHAETIVTQDYYIPFQNNYKIHLKEKRLVSKQNSPVVTLLNPLSIPAIVAFDIPGYSLMDTLANEGFDVWGIDFIDEGKSSFEKELQIYPAPIGKLPLSATDAVIQLNTAINFISHKSSQKQVSLLGWSWGSVVAAMYAIKYPTQVNKLVFYGAMYSSKLPQFTRPYANKDGQFNDLLPAYQDIPWSSILSHWVMMMKGKNLATTGAIQAVEKAYSKIDESAFIPGSIRRPMGPMKDLFTIWNNKPIYDITKITQPTLIIYGEEDMFADKDLYSKLHSAKKEIRIKNATHWILYEDNREQLNSNIITFLSNGNNETTK